MISSYRKALISRLIDKAEEVTKLLIIFLILILMFSAVVFRVLGVNILTR